MRETIDYAERLTRAALEKLPDGEWSFEDWIDDDGVERIEIQREEGPDPRLAQPTHAEWVTVGRAELRTHERPDVALVHPHHPDNLRCGWRFVLERAALPGPGPHRLRVLAWNREQRSAPLGSTKITFVDPPADRGGAS